MRNAGGVPINRLPTGVPGLDAVLGGGLPEFSFNLVAGAPGAGKTTLVQHTMFEQASVDRPALYFTVLGEPPLKMLRYQQQYDYFDESKIGTAIRFVNLNEEIMQDNLGVVLDRIVQEVESANPALVIVDSFRTVVRKTVSTPAGEMDLQSFVQRLAIFLTSWHATSFLVGEYAEGEVQDNPVFTVADGLFWLSQSVERSSVVRKIQIVKLRGQAPIPGLHTFRISDRGIQVFPRTFGLSARPTNEQSMGRVSTGVPGLDEMLDGGLRVGDSALIAGPSGAGKTVLCTQFIAEGVKQNEAGVIVVFEEHPDEYISRAESLGLPMAEMIEQKKVRVVYLRPLDLSVDETLQELLEAVEEIDAKRVALDSLAGFEMALAPAFREDFRESLYRMLLALTGRGVTVLSSMEVTDSYNQFRFSPHSVSFLTDDIILMRYVEIDGRLRTVLTVVKMRRSAHSSELRLYEITSRGVVVGETLGDYRGIITGVPERVGMADRRGLTQSEDALLHTLIALREATIPELAERTGLRRGFLKQFLSRLVLLNYAEVVEGKTGVYRAKSQPDP